MPKLRFTNQTIALMPASTCHPNWPDYTRIKFSAEITGTQHLVPTPKVSVNGRSGIPSQRHGFIEADRRQRLADLLRWHFVGQPIEREATSW
jgi:hypothetical protein